MKHFITLTLSKKHFITFALSLLLASPLFAQHHGNQSYRGTPVFKEISGLSIIKEIYPNAVSVNKLNEVWFAIVDDNNSTIGYTLSSKPYSSNIKGYHNETPIIIVMDTNQKVQKIAILSNHETESYIRRLANRNFFKSWDGLTPKEALATRAKHDTYTGATETAVALIKNVELILDMALKHPL